MFIISVFITNKNGLRNLVFSFLGHFGVKFIVGISIGLVGFDRVN